MSRYLSLKKIFDFLLSVRTQEQETFSEEVGGGLDNMTLWKLNVFLKKIVNFLQTYSFQKWVLSSKKMVDFLLL